MNKNTKRGLVWLTADNLSDAGAVHAFTTRYGGISEGYFASLNLSYSRGDDPNRVTENFRILARAVGYSFDRLAVGKQVHGDVVRVVGDTDCGMLSGHPGVCPLQTNFECDAMITDIPDLPLMVFTADCVPILLFDPVRRVAGAVHAGWRGTALGIVAKTVQKMVEVYSCKVSDIVSAVGPCIDNCCFMTDRDVPDAITAALPGAEQFIAQNGRKYSVDLKQINKLWLGTAGVTDISVAEECTACDTDMFWSHRALGEDRGSMGAVIQITDSR